ncbi:MAG TPA: hypothetical protein VHL34_01705 [Rhizomicrobium sp.]|nr:hypothetical protein [Rhizomicrobium sp.]
MRDFPVEKLSSNLKAVTRAAKLAPVSLSQGDEPAFVMLRADLFEKLRAAYPDPRRAYLAGETPPELRELFQVALDELINSPSAPK